MCAIARTSFGGIVFALGDDFRQILPVVPRSDRAQTIAMYVKWPPLWLHFITLRLRQNMRVAAGVPDAAQHAEWLLRVGSGVGGSVLELPRQLERWVLPRNASREVKMRMLIDFVYPDLVDSLHDAAWLFGRCILAPLNSEVVLINDLMRNMIPGEQVECLSADSIEGTEDDEARGLCPTEYLNVLRPSGWPPYTLATKALTSAGGLQQDEVLSPLINFIGDNDGRMPFKMRRRQFPVAPAFAMTINKSQGQTLSTVGIFMTDQVFSHGQMYVALSRSTSAVGIKVLNLDTSYAWHPHKVRKVVRSEVL